MTFRQFFMESSWRDQLRVPQNPKHHPEGDVDRHTYMVRNALPLALDMFKAQVAADPTGPFSNIDPNFSQSDINLLRLGGMLHDIGKGEALDPTTNSAHAHESPKMFEKAMKRLGPVWQKMYANASPADKADLWFMITHHMSLDDRNGLKSRSLMRDMLDDQGTYKPDRRVKLLLVLFMMDRIGRGGSADFTRSQAREFARTNREPGEERIQGMYKASVAAKAQGDKERAHRAPPAPDSPEEFINLLRGRRLDNSVIAKALANKRPDLSPEEIESYLRQF